MARTSPVHYIAPSSISIIPNANGSADDLALYVAKGAKIKVYSPLSGIDTIDGDYQEWTLSGRNRRLGEDVKPYTIYARLPKDEGSRDSGYIVFAAKTQVGNEWRDKYNYVTADGLTDIEGATTDSDNWYIRLGDVSLPAEGQRTIDYDTGILGTEQFNTEWALNPDSLPLRVELGCTIDNEDAGPTPYVYWGQSLALTAFLTEGWTSTDIQRFDHWEIARDSGDTDADNTWNGGTSAVEFRSTGSINLQHGRGTGQGVRDDFNSAVSAVFTVNAMENTGTEENPVYAVLKSASICIMAETWEKYELALSSQMVTYNPITQTYSPSDGVTFNIRAINQKGETFMVTNGQLLDAGVTAQYALVGVTPEVWTLITISGPNDSVAEGAIAAQVFSDNQKSVNIRLRNANNVELSRGTVAFLRDGEDSKEREWIFLRSTEAITFGTQEHPYPASIIGGQVNPTGAATGSDTNKNQDGWVPQGWWDEQQGVDATNRFEYGAYRDFVHESGNTPAHWGAFTTPKIWNHYGKDGQDMRENIVDNSEPKSTTVINSRTETTKGNNYCHFGTTDKSYEPAKIPADGSKVSGQARVTLSGCAFKSNANGSNIKDGQPYGHVLLYFQTSNAWPHIVEFDVYDNGVYDVMAEDTTINSNGGEWTGQVLWRVDNFVHNSGTISFERVKLEVGDKCSGWCLSENDKRITKINEVAEYQVADSGTTTPSGTWQSTKQAAIDDYNTAHSISGHDWQPNTFMWTRTTITWSDNSTTVLYGAERNPNDGQPGMDIVAGTTTIQYKQTETNVQPTSGWGDYPSVLTQGWYLWSKATTPYYKDHVGGTSAGESVTYNVSYIAEDGAPGRGITGVIEYYKATANASGETAPADGQEVANGWSTDPNAAMQNWNQTNKYLWNYEKVTYSSGNPDIPTPAVLAIWTKDGAAGKGIDSITNYYKVTNSATVPSKPSTPGTEGWSTTPTAPGHGEYLWNYEVITWINPSSTTETAVQMIGYSGKDGRNAVRIDLDNQADLISLDSDGKVRFSRTVVVHAKIYDGATPVTSGVTNTTTIDSLVIGGCTPTVSLSGGKLTITWTFTKGMTAAAAEKTIKLTYNSVEYFTVFSLGTTDSDAVYQLKPNKTSLSFGRDANGALTPSMLTVKCGYTKNTGSEDVPYEWPYDTEDDSRSGCIEYETGKYYYILFRLLDANGDPIPTFSGQCLDGWDWTRGYGLNRKDHGNIIVLNTHTYSAVEFGLCKVMPSYTVDGVTHYATDADMLDIESVPVVREGAKGTDGTSPYFADIDNEMESIACTYNGFVDGTQNVSTNVSMFHGTTPLTPTVTVYDGTEDPANQYTSGEAKDGITVTITDGHINVAFANNTDLSSVAKKEFLIKQVAEEQTRYLTFTVNIEKAARPGEHATLYSLVPSADVITKDEYGVPTFDILNFNIIRRVGTTETVITSISDFSSAGLKLYHKVGSGSEVEVTTTYMSGSGAYTNVNYHDIEELYGATNGVIEWILRNTSGQLLDKEGIGSVQDGTSPYFADIDSETDSVACDATGKVNAAYSKDINIRLWHGDTKMELTNILISGTTSAVTVTIKRDGSNKITGVTVSVSADTVIPLSTNLTFTPLASGAPTDLSVHFVLNGVRPGADGTQYQRIYKSSSSSTVATPSGDTPSGWSDTPTTINTVNRYRHVSERKSTDGGSTWGQWSPPVIDAYLSEDGTSISIKGSAVGVKTLGQSDPTDPGNIGDIWLKNNNDTADYVRYEGVAQDTYAWVGKTAAIGDGYLIDGYLWMKMNNTTSLSQPRWKNIGLIKGPKGDDGDDAVNVVVSPASMIVEQDINDKNNIQPGADTNLGKFSIQVLKGSTSCTITSITAVPSHVSISEFSNGYYYDSSHTWQLASTIADMYLRGIGSNSSGYYTTGQITLSIEYIDPATNTSKTISGIIAKVYVNLIGTWSETVKGDMKTELAHSSLFDVDAQGNLVEEENWGEFYRSSTQSISRLSRNTDTYALLTNGNECLFSDEGFTGITGKFVHLKKGKYIVYADLDTSDIPTGYYVFTVGSFDFSGNTRIVEQEITVETEGDYLITLIDDLDAGYGKAVELYIAERYSTTSELKQTADEITSEVKAIKNGKNVLSGVLDGTGWRGATNGITPHAITGDVVDNWIPCNSGDVYVVSPDISVKKDTAYTYSFDVPSYASGAITVLVYTTSFQQLFSLASNTSGRRKVTFAPTANTVVMLYVAIDKIHYPQLEAGSEASPFEAPTTAVMSQIKQTSDNIHAAVVTELDETGIDIVRGKVAVLADNFTVGKDGVQVFGVDSNTGVTTLQDVDIKGSLMYHKVRTRGLSGQGDIEQLFTMYDENGYEVQMTGATSSNKVVKIVLNYDVFIVSGAHKDFYQIFLPPARYFAGAKIKIVNGTYNGGSGSPISSNPSILDLCIFYANTGVENPGDIDETFHEQDLGYMSNSIMAGIPFDYITSSDTESTLIGPVQTDNAIKVWDNNHRAYGIRFSGYKTIELVSTLNTYLSTKTYYAWMIVDAK